ncbi:protein CFAP276-like [Amphiura filiformis]|uniref:protein CFAP276-like n=1 Tax=Amphiura filiformis TaxID=82378 RepID=UPI003B2138A7
MELSNRDPYPFPRLQNDDSFIGATQTYQDVSNRDPTHIAQKQDPWDRLNTTATLASSRREIYHHDPKAARDSLDFILKANYDHHGAFLQSKSETLVQPETVGANHGRILKNRTKEVERPFDPMSPPLRKIEIHDPKKDSLHSVKGAIESHHSAATNQGYSRKHDGGFYT